MRPNLHHRSEIDALADRIAAEDPEERRVAALAGEPGSGRSYLLARAVEAGRTRVRTLFSRLDLDGYEPDELDAEAFRRHHWAKVNRERDAATADLAAGDLESFAVLALALGRDEESERLAELAAAGSLDAMADGLGDDERLVVHVADSAALPGPLRYRLLELAARSHRFIPVFSCAAGDGAIKVTRESPVARFVVSELDAGEVRLAAPELDLDRCEEIRAASRGLRAAAARMLRGEPAVSAVLDEALRGVPEERRSALRTFAHLAALCGENIPVRTLLGYVGAADDDLDDWVDSLDETIGADSAARFFASRFQHPSFPNELIYGFADRGVAAELRAALPEESRARVAGELLTYLAPRLRATTRAAARLLSELCGWAQADRERMELERQLALWCGRGEERALRAMLAAELKAGRRDAGQLWETVNAAQFAWPAFRTLAVLEAVPASSLPGPLRPARAAIRSGLLLALGRNPDAESEALAALPDCEDAVLRLILLHRAAAAQQRTGRAEIAATTLRRASSVFRDLTTAGDPRLANILDEHLRVLEESGLGAEADELRALAVRG